MDYRVDHRVDMEEPDRARAERRQAGLCADCQYARRVESVRGSTFYRCERSITDRRFSKYPRLPVLECAGYEPSTIGTAQQRRGGS